MELVARLQLTLATFQNQNLENLRAILRDLREIEIETKKVKKDDEYA